MRVISITGLIVHIACQARCQCFITCRRPSMCLLISLRPPGHSDAPLPPSVPLGLATHAQGGAECRRSNTSWERPSTSDSGVSALAPGEGQFWKVHFAYFLSVSSGIKFQAPRQLTHSSYWLPCFPLPFFLHFYRYSLHVSNNLFAF